MDASTRGHTNIIELLFNAGALVNGQNIDGHLALMFAYNGKNQVETLYERYDQFIKESEVESSKKEDVDDGGTGTIIHDALDKHNKMVKLLAKNGADDKDKEVHAVEDFHFHPDAGSEVLVQEEKAGKKWDESKNE